jgi:hypothetical protein
LDSINMYMVRQRVRQMENAESSFYRFPRLKPWY